MVTAITRATTPLPPPWQSKSTLCQLFAIARHPLPRLSLIWFRRQESKQREIRGVSGSVPLSAAR